MKLLMIVALALPQFCYTWIDKFGSETLCQKATVVQLAPHRFRVSPPQKKKWAVDCRVYRDYHIVGTIIVPTGNQCDGFILDGQLLDDKKAPELVLAH